MPAPFDHGPARRHVDRRRLKAETDRIVGEQRARQVNDTAADANAMRLTEALEHALLDLERGEATAFERAARKSDHVEELRRVLGILLDVLADWEMVADRSG